MSSALWNDFRYLWTKCLLTGPFKQKIGHFWDDYENWQFSLLLWHPLYKCKSYSASFPRLVEDFLRKFSPFSPCCIIVPMSMFYDDKSGRCHLCLFNNNSASPNFPSTGWDDIKNWICLKLSHPRAQGEPNSSLMRTQNIYLCCSSFSFSTNLWLFEQTHKWILHLFSVSVMLSMQLMFSPWKLYIPAGHFAIAFDKNCGSLHKKWRFPLGISSVNVTKSEIKKKEILN